MGTKSGNKFFQPVVGGQKDGYTFKKHLFRAQFLGALLILIGFDVAITLQMPAGTGKVLALCLIGTAEFVLTFNSLQHWKDLKNHTSR